jgi:hypothetical protein
MSSSNSGSDTNKISTGIVQGHAYTFAGVLEFNQNGNNVRLCKLRNPWGEGEWKGPWCDNDSRWTPELRQKYNVNREDDGDFYMPYEEYLREYRATSFAMEENAEKYKHSQIKSDFTN